MAYRWRGRFFEVDPDDPRAEGICDRCGFRFNLYKMVWQYDYRGTSMPINTRVLTCGRPSCLDEPQPQNSPLILPPDPMPVFNARPEPYVLDESSWLATEDSETITTESDVPITTAVPDPSSIAATAHLEAIFSASGASVATCYLDIFNGNPTAGGRSVLADITGSTTRTNVASSLTTILGIAKNPDVITVTTESQATVNTNYLAFYDAASSGSLVLSGPLNVRGLTVTEGNPVVFDPLGIQININ